MKIGIKILKILIIIIFLTLLTFVYIGFKKEKHIDNTINSSQRLFNIQSIMENNTKEPISVNIETIPKEHKGYKVGAILEIPSIELKTNVLEEYSKKGLDICVSKFWGADPNEIGNYCIAGHNYEKEDMFYDLYKLKIGDEIKITDNKNRTYKYQVYDIYKVKPKETECLSQNTNGKREVTLITCTKYATYRLIIKAKQV